jgi:hypothetical protein
VLCVVVICTISVPEEFAVTDRLDGLNTQSAYCGNDAHWNVNVLADPPSGVSVNEYVAVCPLATVWLDEPVVAGVKSNPTPDSATAETAGCPLKEIDRVPLTGPAPAGEKTTFAVQLAFAASEAPHVVLEIRKPVDTVSTMLSSASVALVLVSVTAVGLLLAATPVVGNVICEG